MSSKNDFISSFDAIIGISNESSAIKEVSSLANDYVQSLNSAVLSPRTQKFVSTHTILSTSYASIASDPNKVSKLLFENARKYVTEARSYNVPTCPLGQQLFHHPPNAPAEAYAAPPAPAGAPLATNFHPLPGAASVPLRPEHFPAPKPTQFPALVPAQHPPPYSAQYPPPYSSPWPSQFPAPRPAPLPAAAIAPFPSPRPSAPSVDNLPAQEPEEASTSRSDLRYNGSLFDTATTYRGRHPKDDAAEYGIGADFVDCAQSCKFSRVGRGAVHARLYKCRKCNNVKALENLEDGAAVVHAHDRPCTHATGSYSFNKNEGGKDGLPPSIKRYVDEELARATSSSMRNVKDLKSDETVRSIVDEIQNNQYFRTAEMKAAMRRKVKSYFKNWKDKKVRLTNESQKVEQVADGIGVISSHAKLQEYVIHHVPSYPDEPLPVPQDLQQVEDQAKNILKILPDRQQSRSSNRFVALEVPEDQKLKNDDRNGSIRKGIMVFTTIALLYNVVVSHVKYNDVAMGSLDVTAGVGASKKCILAFTLISNTKKGNQMATPVAYAVISTESDVSSTSTILAIKNALKKLWGIDFVLRVGTIADHSACLYNSLEYCFPYTLHGDCWMHFKMKVCATV